MTDYTKLIERAKDQRDRDAAEHCPAEIIALQDEVIAGLEALQAENERLKGALAAKTKGYEVRKALEPLTDEQISEMRQNHGITSNGRGIKEWTQVVDFVRSIEAALGIRARALEPHEDTKRLDALEASNVGKNMWIVARGKDSFTVALKSPYGNCLTRRTLREAIDAATASHGITKGTP